MSNCSPSGFTLKEVARPQVKALVLTECASLGASAAKVGVAHGINANIVHRWLKDLRQAEGSGAAQSPASQADLSSAPMQLLPVATLAGASQASVPASSQSIKLNLRRGAITMEPHWPTSAIATLSDSAAAQRS